MGDRIGGSLLIRFQLTGNHEKMTDRQTEKETDNVQSSSKQRFFHDL